MSAGHSVLCITGPFQHFNTRPLDPVWSCLAKYKQSYWKINFIRERHHVRNINHTKNTKISSFLYEMIKNKMTYPAHITGLKTFDTTFMNIINPLLPHPSLDCILGTTFRFKLYRGWFITIFRTNPATNSIVVSKNISNRCLNIYF